MKYLASVSYDGSKYYGFQKLNSYKTVQESEKNEFIKLTSIAS